MAKMKTLTVNGESYTVEDADSVSFGEAQELTTEQQERARENIGACKLDDSSVGSGAWSSKNTVDKLCPTFTESGTVVVCEPVEGYPLEVVSKIVLKQDGTGDPSPDNIRPISGHSAVKLTRCGKNLINPVEYMEATVTDNRTTLDGDVFTTNFTNGGLHLNPKGNYRVSHPKGTYTLSFIPLTAGATAAVYVYAKSNLSSIVANINVSSSTPSVTFTANEEFYLSLAGVSNSYGTYSYKLQLEVGRNATAYEQFKGDTFTMDLGQTVYGGSLDWATGLLTIDREFKTLTGSGGGIQAEAMSAFTRITINSCTNNGEIQGDVCNHLSSHFKTYHGNYSSSIPVWSIGGNKGVSRCWLYCDTAVVGTTLDSVNAWLKGQYDAGNPVQVSYKLATPITVQLTTQEILALSGVNTLYSDTGDTEVTGKANPSAIIEKLTNAILSLGGNV